MLVVIRAGFQPVALQDADRIKIGDVIEAFEMEEIKTTLV